MIEHDWEKMIIQGSEDVEEPDKTSPWHSIGAKERARAKNPSKDRLSAHFSAHTGVGVPEGCAAPLLVGKTGS